MQGYCLSEHIHHSSIFVKSLDYSTKQNSDSSNLSTIYEDSTEQAEYIDDQGKVSDHDQNAYKREYLKHQLSIKSGDLQSSLTLKN